MATPIKVTVMLDVERELTWGPRAKMRLNSLARPPQRRGIYLLAATCWAMLGNDEAFKLPDDLAEYLQTAEQVKTVGNAILAAQEQAADSEKNGHGSKRRRAPASS